MENRESDREVQARIDRLRAGIDQVDEALLNLVALRNQLALRIGRLKLQAGMPLYSEQRVCQVLEGCRLKAEELGLEPERVEVLFRHLIDMAMGTELGDCP